MHTKTVRLQKTDRSVPVRVCGFAQKGRMSRFCTHCGEVERQTIPKAEKVFGIF